MLLDEANDPHELKNLANDPAYAKTVQEMKSLLKQLPGAAAPSANEKAKPK
jgi:hypothetical protein